MLTIERVEDLKNSKHAIIYYCGGYCYPVQKCYLLDYDSRYSDLYYETVEEATAAKQAEAEAVKAIEEAKKQKMN